MSEGLSEPGTPRFSIVYIVRRHFLRALVSLPFSLKVRTEELSFMLGLHPPPHLVVLYVALHGTSSPVCRLENTCPTVSPADSAVRSRNSASALSNIVGRVAS